MEESSFASCIPLKIFSTYSYSFRFLSYCLILQSGGVSGSAKGNEPPQDSPSRRCGDVRTSCQITVSDNFHGAGDLKRFREGGSRGHHIYHIFRYIENSSAALAHKNVFPPATSIIHFGYRGPRIPILSVAKLKGKSRKISAQNQIILRERGGGRCVLS